MAFRITPSLGPDVEQVGPVTGFYWDLNNVSSAGVQRASYQLGSKVTGSDGHQYVFVISGGTIAAAATVAINETTWVATAGGAKYAVPPAITAGVVIGQFFHAREVLL